MLSETDKAYIAGIIDGEGCITVVGSSVGRGNSKSYTLRLMIAQADREFIEYLRDKLGKGTICRNTANPHVYFLQVTGKEAESVLRLVYDYLIIKKDQADVAFQFRMTKAKVGGDYCHAGQHGGGRIPQPLQNLRKYYVDELKRLKVPKEKGRLEAKPEPELANLLKCQTSLPGLDDL